MTTDNGYIRHLPAIAAEDARFLAERDASYGSSWKRRGGVGAFMMAARKWDRLENILSQNDGTKKRATGTGHSRRSETLKWDIFSWIETEEEDQGSDGSVLAEVRDLRRYLLLVEAEMVERGVVAAPVKQWDSSKLQGLVGGVAGSYRPAAVPVEDSSRHANRLRRQVNHIELMELAKADQLRYKWEEGEQAYILQPGKVVILADGLRVFLPEKISQAEMDSLAHAFGSKVNMPEYYHLDYARQAWYLIVESDRD